MLYEVSAEHRGDDNGVRGEPQPEISILRDMPFLVRA
jgi:hypothetical protein